MTDLEKLKHLLEHWMEHNEAHVQTYGEWASKADSLGKGEIAVLLRQVIDESNKLKALLKKAAENLEFGV
ncbi:MAG: hypothetical protein HZA14_10085 [Nitrospirae bacterium]|nr:hypothetical protein [Nitrospirota bacterium]